MHTNLHVAYPIPDEPTLFPLVNSVAPKHEHVHHHDGPRVPLVYGSAATSMCICGSWRTMHHSPGPWYETDIRLALVPDEEW